MLSNEDIHTIYGSKCLPTYSQIETNTRCGAGCKMCPRSKTPLRREMTWGELLRIIDAVAPYTETICPFLMQEPTWEPRLPQILSYIKQVNSQCKTVVYSNMSQWTPELTDLLLDRGTLDELYISFYAPTRKLYKTWQPGLDYDEVTANIKYFFEQNNGDISTSFNYIAITDLMGENNELADTFIKRWGDYATVRFVHYDTFHGTMPQYGDNDLYFGEKTHKRTPCSRLWGGLNVQSNGNVIPCCIDFGGEVVFGNVNETPVTEIWRNEAFEEFRQLHLDGKQDEIPLCRDCMVWRHHEQKEWIDVWTK